MKVILKVTLRFRRRFSSVSSGRSGCVVPTPRVRKFAGGSAAANQSATDIIGALLAEQHIGALDAGAVTVAGELDGGLFAETGGLRDDVADLFLSLSDGVFLAGLKFGAADRKYQYHRFDRALWSVELQADANSEDARYRRKRRQQYKARVPGRAKSTEARQFLPRATRRDFQKA